MCHVALVSSEITTQITQSREGFSPTISNSLEMKKGFSWGDQRGLMAIIFLLQLPPAPASRPGIIYLVNEWDRLG